MTKQYSDELKRAPAGKKYIYVITETETGKMYIGQTRNFHARMCSHRNCRYSQHSAIDRVIQEKGVDAFEYEVLELCTEDEADERERYWIEKTDSCNEQKGFNIFKGGQKSFSNESYAMQFIGCAIERVTTDKYAFSEMCTGTKLLKDVIMLPKDKTGQPDWGYMEEYMRKMERKTNDVLNFLDRISTRRKIDGV